MLIIYPGQFGLDKYFKYPEAYKKDAPFMEQAGKVLESMPDTWKRYPDNEIGAGQIVDMEYTELKGAADKQSKSRELVHLAAACLHEWRKLNE